MCAAKKRHEKKLHARSLDPWVSSSYPILCVFVAEPTKVWPWRPLCWVLFQVECRNYIRTLHKVNATTMYVCGTNAFSPTCDYMVSLASDAESFKSVFYDLSLN